jgi:hypothetical protein
VSTVGTLWRFQTAFDASKPTRRSLWEGALIDEIVACVIAAGLVFAGIGLFRAVGDAHPSRSKAVACLGAIGITLGFLLAGVAVLAGAWLLVDTFHPPPNGIHSIWTRVLMGGVAATIFGFSGRNGWRIAKTWMSRPKQA